MAAQPSDHPITPELCPDANVLCPQPKLDPEHGPTTICRLVHYARPGDLVAILDRTADETEHEVVPVPGGRDHAVWPRSGHIQHLPTHLNPTNEYPATQPLPSNLSSSSVLSALRIHHSPPRMLAGSSHSTSMPCLNSEKLPRKQRWVGAWVRGWVGCSRYRGRGVMGGDSDGVRKVGRSRRSRTHLSITRSSPAGPTRLRDFPSKNTSLGAGI